MAVRKNWIWGVSGKHKYAVKDLVEIEWVYNELNQKYQVIACKRIGYGKVLLKEYPTQIEAQKFINETFPSK